MIESYLDASSRRPFIYGGGDGGFRGHDCTLWPANWALSVSGLDPADDMRGTYDTREGAEAIVVEAGGFVPLLSARLLRVGWRRTDDIQDGAIGVVSIPLRPGHHAQGPAIRFGNRWLMMFPRGMRQFPANLHILSAWGPA